MANAEITRPGANAPVVHPSKARRPAPWPVSFYRSAVGKKWVMALTGIAIMGFVLGHMVGNLKVYMGADDFNHYGEFLRHLFAPLLPNHVFLWIVRVGLLLAFGFHIHSAYTLTRLNREARPERYQSDPNYVAATFAARTMRWTGIIVLLYVLFHLADLTWGWANPSFERGDVYGNLVASFQRWPVALIYIAANIAVAVHLYHGAWSIFQSMGVNSPRYNGARRAFATGFAVLIGVANCTFPIMVMLHVVE